jgi:hypothetical protein
MVLYRSNTMTVIACKDSIMAADSAVWCGDIVVAHRKKIIRLPDGSLFGGAGSTPIIHMAQEWIMGAFNTTYPVSRLNLNDHLDKPTRVLAEHQLDGMILRPDGSLWHLNYQWDLYDMTVLFAACGSHHDFVLGAMYAGATAERAVKLAIEHGDSASGDVQVEYLSPTLRVPQ